VAFALVVLAIGALLAVLAGPVLLLLAAVAALVLAAVAYLYADRLVLRLSHARPVSPDEEPRYHNLVEGLCVSAGLPKPELYVIDDEAANSFAAGRNPAHAAIVVTTGLLQKLDRMELEGVVAHELSHVVDRDILVGTVVATLVGAVVLVAEFMLRWFWWGGIGGRRGNDQGGGAATAIFAGIGIVLLILAPIFAQLIKFAVSRRREYLADAQGAMLTRYPPGLASALQKIAVAPHAMRSANNATAHLWLDQPSRVQGEQMGFLEKLFSTHPPIQDRIRILQEM
jgi:heat shock protein HtpX